MLSRTRVDLDYHVRLHAPPRPAGMAELWKLVSHLHGGQLDRGHPLWQMHLIEGLADGGYALYIKIHHALTDGVSAMKLIQHRLSTDPARRGMPAPWEPTRHRRAPDNANSTGPDGFGPLAAARRVFGAAGEAIGVVSALADTTWRALRGRGGPLTLAAPHTRFNTPISSVRSFAGCAFPLKRLRLGALGAAPLALTMMSSRPLGPLRPANVMISNVPGPTGSRYWNGARFDALYPLSVPVDGQALNITCASIDDQIMFGLTGCRRAVPAIDTLAEFLGRELDLLSGFRRLPLRGRPRGPQPRRFDAVQPVAKTIAKPSDARVKIWR